MNQPWQNTRVTWQEGSSSADDVMFGAAETSDGSIILCGYTEGNWTAAIQGDYDYAVVKLDSNGEVVWRRQVKGRVHLEKAAKHSKQTGPLS